MGEYKESISLEGLAYAGKNTIFTIIGHMDIPFYSASGKKIDTELPDSKTIKDINMITLCSENSVSAYKDIIEYCVKELRDNRYPILQLEPIIGIPSKVELNNSDPDYEAIRAELQDGTEPFETVSQASYTSKEEPPSIKTGV